METPKRKKWQKEAAPEYFDQRTYVENTQRSIHKERTTNVKFKGSENAMMPTVQAKPGETTSDPHTMATIESLIEKRLDGYICVQCDFKSNRISHVKEHAEKHIEGLEYPCNSCNKVFRSSQCLRKHNNKDCCHNL